MTRRRAPNHAEGDVFVLPLRDGGFARGVVARSDGQGRAFGYFFGPRLAGPEDARVDASLRPEDALLIGKFGDLGLLEGAWRVIGRIEPWSRTDWPMPPQGRIGDGEEVGFLSWYDEDTLECIAEERRPREDLAPYPYDRLMGYGAVEIRLGDLLRGDGGR